MRSFTPSPAAVPDSDEHGPRSEETFAAALALMTAHAQAAASRQPALAQAVSAHLARIASVACASAECRLALSVLAAHWAALSDASLDLQEDLLLWHAAPATIQ